jgi:S1-C subfamily serine protease
MFCRNLPRLVMNFGVRLGMDARQPDRWALRLVVSSVILTSLLVLPGVTFGQTFEKRILDSVKDATVYIKIKVNGKMLGSGSGFVFKVLNGSVLVMTNRHVAVPDLDELPENAKVELSAVFRSGTPQEQELPGVLKGYGFGEISDLAVLEVKGLTQIPEPIKADMCVAESEMFETMQAYAIGFPLGGQIQQIAGNVKQNPAVTVNSMTISSLRRDESNILARIQFAGSIIGGNSGGPVVDAKGRLLGVVVSRLVGENVGFAVPPVVISEFLSGSLGEPLLVEVLGSVGPETQLKIVWRSIDPLGRAGSFGISYTHQPIPPDGFKRIAGGNTGYPLLPGATPVKMIKNGDQVSVTFPLPIKSQEDRKLHLQLVQFDFTGKIIANSIPLALMIPDRPGKIYDYKKENRAKSLAKWSCETNLAEGIKMKHQPGATTIDIPPGAYNNAPQYNLFNAPCALVKVDGDFLAAVEIPNTFDPGGEGVLVPTSKHPLPFSFQSAGLLIWQDERNFVRFERNKKSEGGLAMVSQLLVEVYKNGKSVAIHYIDIPERQQVGVAAIRKGGSLRLLFGLLPDQLGTFYEMAIDFKSEVFVGVAAANLSKRTFHAKLENFQLMTLEKNPIEVKPFKMAKLVDTGYSKLPDGTCIYEGAGLRTTGKDGGSVVPQTNMADFKGAWSDNRQLLWNNDKADGSVSLELPIEADGKYEIKAKFTLSPDYAIAKLDLDGRPLYKGSKIDFYSKDVRPTSLMTLGTLSLNKGKHKLNITAYKKNPKSSGYHFGLDELQLVPAK